MSVPKIHEMNNPALHCYWEILAEFKQKTISHVQNNLVKKIPTLRVKWSV